MLEKGYDQEEYKGLNFFIKGKGTTCFENDLIEL
jgi:hypothetical protein